MIKSTIYDLHKSGESASIQKAEPATLFFHGSLSPAVTHHLLKHLSMGSTDTLLWWAKPHARVSNKRFSFSPFFFAEEETEAQGEEAGGLQRKWRCGQGM